MLCSRGRAHHNLEICQTGCLPRRPMDTCCPSTWGYSSQIQNKVPNLPEEHIRRRPALVPIILVFVTVDQTHSFELWRGLDHRTSVWVANQLSKVVIDDRLGDDIGARREVYNRRGCAGCSTAFRGGTIAIADGSVDSGRIISLAVT